MTRAEFEARLREIEAECALQPGVLEQARALVETAGAPDDLTPHPTYTFPASTPRELALWWQGHDYALRVIVHDWRFTVDTHPTSLNLVSGPRKLLVNLPLAHAERQVSDAIISITAASLGLTVAEWRVMTTPPPEIAPPVVG